MANLCATCRDWEMQSGRAKTDDKKWGYCFMGVGQHPAPPIRCVCPYEQLETREDFGCVEWHSRGNDGKMEAQNDPERTNHEV